MDDDITFIDIEASGLHRTSYPIEVGWSGMNLKADSFMINPPMEWSFDDWSSSAELVHGLSFEEITENGISVIEGANRLNETMRDKAVFSDAPEFDGFWLRRLYEAARIEPAFPLRLLPAMDLIKNALRERLLPTDLSTIEEYERSVDVKYPRPHRAGPDAVHLAALYRAAKGL